MPQNLRRKETENYYSYAKQAARNQNKQLVAHIIKSSFAVKEKLLELK